MMRRILLILLVICLTSCRTQTPPDGNAPRAQPEYPSAIYQADAVTKVYEIAADRSRADIVVRRGGALARLGHDHVVSATKIEGLVLLAEDDFRNSRADLRLNLDTLIVDDPIVRERFDLDTRPTEQDIEKTTQNMHGKVLQTDIWPVAHLQIEITGGNTEAPDARLTVFLHGEKHDLPLSFHLEGAGTDQLEATGTFRLQQTDYGIHPFSVLGGALQVLDPVDVTFSMVAERRDSRGGLPTRN